MEKINITRIEFQNNRKKTYYLYENDAFITEISEDTLVHFSIFKNTSIGKEMLENIIEHDKVNSCLSQAYNYLQRRPHLKKELYRKLINKQFTKEIIEKTFHRLEQNKYINDNEFIKMFIRDAVREAKSGPRLITKKLLEKGALIKDIEINLDDLFPLANQIKIATTLITKKHDRLEEKNILKRKQKLLQYGVSRGFNWDILGSIINTLHRQD